MGERKITVCIKSIVNNPPPDFGGKDYNALLQQKTKALREALHHRGKGKDGMMKTVEGGR